MNYYRDRFAHAKKQLATKPRFNGTITLELMYVPSENRSGYDYEENVSLPAKRVVCPYCDGEGRYANPSVECDGGGFTASEWEAEDDDFKEEYLNGAWDIPCEECHGARVVERVDYDALSPEQKKAYEFHRKLEDYFEAEHAAERRMGC